MQRAYKLLGWLHVYSFKDAKRKFKCMLERLKILYVNRLQRKKNDEPMEFQAENSMKEQTQEGEYLFRTTCLRTCLIRSTVTIAYSMQ